MQGKRQSIAVGSKVTRKSRDKDVVITKNVHPAIVSEEEYEIAKATIAFMKKPDYRGARKFALKGKDQMWELQTINGIDGIRC